MDTETSTENTAAETTETAVDGGEWDINVDEIMSGETDGDETGDESGEAEAQTGADTEPKKPAEKETKAETQSAPETQSAEQPAAEAVQDTYTLKHLDETRTVGRDEVVVLAQKGMDYDRIRGKLDTANAELQTLREHDGWLKELAGTQSIEDFMDGVNARRLAERDHVDPDIALQRVKLDREKKALEAERQKAAAPAKEAVQANDAEAKKQADIRAFVQRYPDVAAKLRTDKNAIPSDVWDAVKAGETLVSAYGAFEARQKYAALEAENARLKSEANAAKQTQKNAARATGSQASAGDDGSSDPILSGWNSI